jgi:hypothetical protein
MKTKEEMIAIIKLENPTLQKGDDQQGYTPLNAEEYEAQIEQWAENRLAKEAALAAKELAKQAKSDAAEKLTALGIDPKALGL